MSAKSWTLLVVVLLLGGLGYLFWLQNSLRMTGLSLDLWIWGVQLSRPVSVPLLLLGATGVGVLIGGGLGLARNMSLQRTVRDLKNEVARASLQSDGWG